jgi:hypothetical protein
LTPLGRKRFAPESSLPTIDDDTTFSASDPRRITIGRPLGLPRRRVVPKAVVSSYPDGIASILVGLVLATIAILLAYESKMLLMGESADAEAVRSIRELVESDPAVAKSGPPLTMHLGPEDILLNLDVQFHEGLSTEELIQVVDRLEHTIRAKHSDVRRIFLELERLHDGDGPPTRTPRVAADGNDRAASPGAAGRTPADY